MTINVSSNGQVTCTFTKKDDDVIISLENWRLTLLELLERLEGDDCGRNV